MNVLCVLLITRTQEEAGAQGHKHLENNSGYQENLRCSRTKISGTGAVRREILMISQLSAPELSAWKAASSPEIFVRLHLRFSTVSSELFSRCLWPCAPASSCCFLAEFTESCELPRCPEAEGGSILAFLVSGAVFQRHLPARPRLFLRPAT